MDYAIIVISVLLNVLAGLIVGYFASYMATKGKNLATHEDIDKLLDQVNAVTTITKEIEAKISNEVWDRQKRWEMKREVLFDAAKTISEMDDAMLSLSVFMKHDHTTQKEWESQSTSPEERITWIVKKNETLIRWRKVSSGFEGSKSLVRIVCSIETAKSVADLALFSNQLAAELSGGNPDAYDQKNRDWFQKIALAQKAIRKDLEVDP